MASPVKNFHLPLPEPTYRRLREVADRAKQPATVVARHAIETWLREQRKAALHQRTGVNTEAKLLMLTHAFETWRVHCVRLKTDARNDRSRQAILRLGARLDGVLRGHTVAADGTVRHSAFYSILDAEWPEVKQRLRARLR